MKIPQHMPIKRPENVAYLKTANINKTEDLYCVCGIEGIIYHTSNWHDGTGVFYVKCPQCKANKGGHNLNVEWNLEWSEKMKNNYTPGEWKTSGRQIFTFDESKGEEFIDREIIANVYEINKNKEEVEANAKLIRSAPEMYEALLKARQELIEAFKILTDTNSEFQNWKERSETLNIIDTAIKKATQ